MKSTETDMNERATHEMPDGLPSGIKIGWERSREEIWRNIEPQLSVKHEARKVFITARNLRIASAAAVLLIVGLSSVMFLYSRTIEVPYGKHAEVVFPDNSSVVLNAGSEVTYRPLLWQFRRTVRFAGEGFFKVEKGRRFVVVSSQGITTVMGTSFNVYSRDNDYRVMCFTGKVKVSAAVKKSGIIITPGQEARLESDGNIMSLTPDNTDDVISWMNNRLIFTSVPLQEVFYEIERQYGVTVFINAGARNVYTGTFSMDDSVENILNLVCRPFDLSVSKKSENEFVISGNK